MLTAVDHSQRDDAPPANHSFVYLTIDVYTSPPTVVAIVGTDADATAVQAHDPHAVVIGCEDMVPCKGWTDACRAVALAPHRHKSLCPDTLNVCFMHGFGRCMGRQRGDPSSCQQLHINPAVLRQIRSMYRAPTRRYFVREFTGLIPQPLAGELVPSVPLHLKFPSKDVLSTAAAVTADARFRATLASGDGTPLAHPNPIPLCLPHILGLTCPHGEGCANLHVALRSTQTPLAPFAWGLVESAVQRFAAFLHLRLPHGAPQPIHNSQRQTATAAKPHSPPRVPVGVHHHPLGVAVPGSPACAASTEFPSVDTRLLSDLDDYLQKHGNVEVVG